MAGLIKLLRNQGYDYIDGIVRDHKVLQVWNKKDSDKNTSLGMKIHELFKSRFPIGEPERDNALQVDFSQKEEYSFNIGVSVLEGLLKDTGFGNIKLDTKINGGKNLNISFNNAYTLGYGYGKISNFLSDPETDFITPNYELLQQANRNNLLLISGILFAKNLKVDVITTSNVDANLALELSEIAGGDFSFKRENNNQLTIEAQLGEEFPIAVKAFRLKFDKGKYSGMLLVTDNRGDLF